MRIAEIYQSRQGEGLLAGTPSVFVRTSGCNLRCWFCDTPHTSWHPEGEDLSVTQVLARALGYSATHVVLTGGEPMLYSELIPLTERLRTAGRHITIETAGTLFLPVTCDLMSISPKLAGSAPSPRSDSAWHRRHQRSRNAPKVIRQLVEHYRYQVKFVVDSPEDIDEVERYLAEFPEIDRARVGLMPQGTCPEQLAGIASWLQPYCQAHDLHFFARHHIAWYGFVRGS